MTEYRLKLETAAAQNLKERLALELGDNSDTDTLRDTLEGCTNLHELIAATALELAAVEGEKEGIEIAIGKLRERLTRHNNRADAIRRAIFAAMETAELRSLKTPVATLGIRPCPPKVEITDPTAIPSIYMRQPAPEPDKKAIGAALKDGATIPGVTLNNSPDTLSVRFT